MARKSKFFRVAVEGATTDGRKIERSWLNQIAATYNAATYGARIFVEHIRGLAPDSSFRAMGDVLAVKAETVKIDGQDRLALFAQIQPTEEMVALVNSGQKIYSSIEVNPNFADSGQAYLVGMGITDSPASLGTEVLAFAAQNPTASPFAARKQSPDNLFSVAESVELELEDEEAPQGPSLIERVKQMFSGKARTDDARFGEVHSAVEHIAQATGDLAGTVESISQDFAALRESLAAEKAARETAIADLTGRIDHTPNRDPQRPQAAGGNGAVVTDC